MAIEGVRMSVDQQSPVKMQSEFLFGAGVLGFWVFTGGVLTVVGTVVTVFVSDGEAVGETVGVGVSVFVAFSVDDGDGETVEAGVAVGVGDAVTVCDWFQIQ